MGAQIRWRKFAAQFGLPAPPSPRTPPLPSLAQAETGELFSAYLGKFSASTFSYCTDDDAVRRLADAVGAGRKLDMRRPPLEYQASLMVRSASPEYVGSEHIKWMLEQPKMYTVREAARGRVLSWGRGGEASAWGVGKPLGLGQTVSLIV